MTPLRPRVGRAGPGIGDDVVVTILAQDLVEIHTHGGPLAIACVESALVEAGATPSAPRPPTAHGPIASDALALLPKSPTLRIAEILLDQANGLLEHAVRSIIAEIESRDAVRACEQLHVLIARSNWGLHMLNGWRVLLAGPPNAGKSSLLNALLGYQRAIVDPTPGTTRDIVSASTAIDGWPITLCDSAGLRSTADPIEREGVARAIAEASNVDLVLLLIDGSSALSNDHRARVESHPGAILVATKADLPRCWDPTPWAAIAVSSKTGCGMKTLEDTLRSRLVPPVERGPVAVPFLETHAAGLRSALESLRQNAPAQALASLRALVDRDQT
jgi:tRNA modification GTPase